MENTHLLEGLDGGAVLAACRRIHFIGICGVSMRVLARICRDRGYLVSGSDSALSPGSPRLTVAGIPVDEPRGDSEGILGADLAVYSLAIPPDHPEVLTARRRGIPLISRADLFGSLMRPYKRRIGVAGTHGKSTVTAMCGRLLEAAGRRPTVVVGAPLIHGEDGYLPGGEDVLVFEACEYKRSFLSFLPTVAVLTNAEWDHPDCFLDHAAILDAFRAYLSLPTVECAVLPADDADALSLAEGTGHPIITFGITPTADVFASDIIKSDGGCSFLLSLCDQPIGRVSIPLPGEHNVKNALAAYAAAYALGIRPDPLALADFFGVGRRTEYRGSYAGVAYYDDYAHHPSEIRAGLAALRGEGRLFCVFQPHTYTRTAALFSELAEALKAADAVIVTDIYAAREENTTGVSARALADAVGTRALYIPTPEVASLSVRTRVMPGDRVAVMGAGNLSERFFRGPLAFAGK